MPSTLLSSFQRLAATPEEEISGQILNNMQLAILQNLRVDIAEQKLALTFNPDKMYEFVQQESYLSGQLDILQFIIDNSEASQKLVLDRAAQSQFTKTQE